MYLIVGLGNPEPDYSKTRHNMGFDVINKISENYNINVNKTKFQALYGSGNIYGEKVILIKPQTYMNLSGESIIKFVNFYKIPIENIIVVFDDMDIDGGVIKIRKKGGPGTHNGMKSVVSMLGTKEFSRIRIGIGKPKQNTNIVDYVINKLTDDEYKILQEGINKGADAVSEIVKNNIDAAMNKFN